MREGVLRCLTDKDAELLIDGNRIDGVMGYILKQEGRKSSIILEINLTGGSIEVQI